MNSILFAGKVFCKDKLESLYKDIFCKDKMESLNKEVVQPTVYRSLLSGEQVALPRPYFRTVDSACYGKYYPVPTSGLWTPPAMVGSTPSLLQDCGLRLLW
jgi:hypothetical protein